MDWLQELFDLINKNGKFKGDEQTLNEIGKKLALNKTSSASSKFGVYVWSSLF